MTANNPFQSDSAAARGGGHRITVEPSNRRVSVTFAGQTIADSQRALILREAGLPPVFYFPPDDVRTDLLAPTNRHTRCPFKGEASYWSIRTTERMSENAVWSYLDPLPERTDIKGYLAFYPDRVQITEADAAVARPEGTLLSE